MNAIYLTRRRFIQQTTLAGSALLLGGYSTRENKTKRLRASGKAFVRRDISALQPDGPEIESLRRGIQVMKDRPDSDPTSWIFQANIHGAPFGSPPNEAWNQCQHGSFFFLPWHRMYLYFFERILRAASEDPNLSLPFWNYTDPAARALPIAFREPADPSNPLYVSQRAAGINQGAMLPESSTLYSRAFGFTNFASDGGSSMSFGGQIVPQPVHITGPHGQLEMQPHDVVHGLVGGPGGWMNDVNRAARDPIFWLHHANIDRLWNLWLTLGEGRQDPVEEPLWTTPGFTFFDETGTAVTLTACDVVNAQSQLDYSYEDEPTQTEQSCPPSPLSVASVRVARQEIVAASQGPEVELKERPTTVLVNFGVEAKAKLLSASSGVNKQIVFNIEEIDFDRPPGIYYEIYLNLPATSTEVDHRSSHYVGNLAFFGLKPHDSGSHHTALSKPMRAFRITETYRRLRALNLWSDEQLSVTFIPRGLIQPGAAKQAVRVVGKPRFARASVSIE